MNHDQIIRAWKDEDYRSSLGPAELSALPENPAGLVELTEDEVAHARGKEGITLFLPTVCALFCIISYYYSKSEGGTCALDTLGCC